MKVKIFNQLLEPKQKFWMKQTESIDCGLEDEINKWFRQNPDITITKIKQSQSGGSFRSSMLTITLWYE